MRLRPPQFRAIVIILLSTLLLELGLVLLPHFPPATGSRWRDAGMLVGVYLIVTLSCVVDLRKATKDAGDKSD